MKSAFFRWIAGAAVAFSQTSFAAPITDTVLVGSQEWAQVDLFTSVAFGINDSGKVAGRGASVNGTEAFLWDATTGMQGLGDLPGGAFSSTAYGINNSGQVVGVGSGANGQEAFLWELSTGMLSLNALLDGSGVNWFVQEARAINSTGQIVGWGRNPDGFQEAFLLTRVTAPIAVSLPGTLLLSASGLLCLGLSRRLRSL